MSRGPGTGDVTFRKLSLSVVLVGLLQGSFFLWHGNALAFPWGANGNLLLAATISLVTSILVWFFCYRRWSQHRLLPTAALATGQFAILLLFLLRAPEPFSLPFVIVVLLLSYAAVFVAALLIGSRLMDPTRAVALSASLALLVLTGEVLIDLHRESEVRVNAEWSSATAASPSVGFRNVPHGWAKTYYPDDPRDYFEKEEGKRWRVQNVEGALARLAPSKDSQGLRVEIDEVQGGTSWHVQLRQDDLSVSKGARYRLDFRARADRKRRAGVLIVENQEPWEDLGLSWKFDLTTSWKNYSRTFRARKNDTNASVAFLLGRNKRPVEIADVSLQPLSRLGFARADTKGPYSVSYRFNELGCRGPSYEVPPTQSTRKIVALGDSFTLGVGVHHEDTFAEQLAYKLNKQGEKATQYEVINCGMPGYGPREATQAYERLLSSYKPELVLVAVVDHDRQSWREEIDLDAEPSTLEHLFGTWGHLRKQLSFDSRPGLQTSIREIVELDEKCRRRGERVAVVLFRYHSQDSYSEQLLDGIWTAGGAAGIPVLDLGVALADAQSAGIPLEVHPRVDRRPNEYVHDLVATEIMRFLRSNDLI